MSEPEKIIPETDFKTLDKEPDPESFFQKEDGETAYHEQCLNCKKGCKQSFRVTVCYCPKYKSTLLRGGKA